MNVSFTSVFFYTYFQYTASHEQLAGFFYYHGLTQIQASTSNHIHYKMCGEIAYPFPNFNGETVEVWEWISSFIQQFTWYVIIYPCWDYS